jgi:hypothetical protein
MLELGDLSPILLTSGSAIYYAGEVTSFAVDATVYEAAAVFEHINKTVSQSLSETALRVEAVTRQYAKSVNEVALRLETISYTGITTVNEVTVVSDLLSGYLTSYFGGDYTLIGDYVGIPITF